MPTAVCADCGKPIRRTDDKTTMQRRPYHYECWNRTTTPPWMLAPTARLTTEGSGDANPSDATQTARPSVWRSPAKIPCQISSWRHRGSRHQGRNFSDRSLRRDVIRLPLDRCRRRRSRV